MEKPQNKYISVSYQLYSIEDDGSKHLIEQTQQGRPFQFITGFGFSLDAFEQQVAALEPGAKFDFTLQPDEAFGDYDEAGVHKMEREVFMINGRFDQENIYPGAVITLMDKDEKRFMARVEKVDNDGVTIDTNHPLASMTLQFNGLVLENRNATNEEIQNMLNHLSHGCGGDCSGCGGDCDGDCDDDCDNTKGKGCGHCCH